MMSATLGTTQQLNEISHFRRMEAHLLFSLMRRLQCKNAYCWDCFFYSVCGRAHSEPTAKRFIPRGRLVALARPTRPASIIPQVGCFRSPNSTRLCQAGSASEANIG